MTLEGRVRDLRDRIARACGTADRDPAGVELLPVSKRQPLSLVREAAALGFARFGENYVQEGVEKALAAPDLGFVLLGPLQRNKAKAALQHFQEILSLDRPDLADRLARLAEELGVVRPVWIQVDLWDEATKLGGCGGADLPDLLAVLRDQPRLPLAGLMALPPPGLDAAFGQMAELRSRLQDDLGQPLRLSMGMSDDLEPAIAAGTDQVRIGTAFFGPRSR